MKIIISGYGKMGKELEKALKSHKLYIVSPETMTSFNDIKEQVDLIIDFSVPSVIHQIKKFIDKQHECSLILGTTGYKENEESVIKDISNKHKVFKSSNFSIVFFLLRDADIFALNCLRSYCNISTFFSVTSIVFFLAIIHLYIYIFNYISKQ